MARTSGGRSSSRNTFAISRLRSWAPFTRWRWRTCASEGRIDDVEALPGQPVHRAWDLGMRDDTSIWFFQVVGAQI